MFSAKDLRQEAITDEVRPLVLDLSILALPQLAMEIASSAPMARQQAVVTTALEALVMESDEHELRSILAFYHPSLAEANLAVLRSTLRGLDAKRFGGEPSEGGRATAQYLEPFEAYLEGRLPRLSARTRKRLAEYYSQVVVLLTRGTPSDRFPPGVLCYLGNTRALRNRTIHAIRRALGVMAGASRAVRERFSNLLESYENSKIRLARSVHESLQKNRRKIALDVGLTVCFGILVSLTGPWGVPLLLRHAVPVALLSKNGFLFLIDKWRLYGEPPPSIGPTP